MKGWNTGNAVKTEGATKGLHSVSHIAGIIGELVRDIGAVCALDAASTAARVTRELRVRHSVWREVRTLTLKARVDCGKFSLECGYLRGKFVPHIS